MANQDESVELVRAAHKRTIEDILKESVRQNEKFGWNRNHHPAEWLMILGEEVGEVNEEGINYTFNPDRLKPMNLLDMRKELVQVAAVAMAFIEDLDDNYLPKYKNSEQ